MEAEAAQRPPAAPKMLTEKQSLKRALKTGPRRLSADRFEEERQGQTRTEKPVRDVEKLQRPIRPKSDVT